jgi:hypothetical protein
MLPFITDARASLQLRLGAAALKPLTCILTTCPSPLLPLIVAVTTTSVLLFTKFRMHRSFLVLWPECATRSNLRACENGRTTRRIRMSSMIDEYLLVAGAMIFGCTLEVLRSGDVAESFCARFGRSSCYCRRSSGRLLLPLSLW